MKTTKEFLNEAVKRADKKDIPKIIFNLIKKIKKTNDSHELSVALEDGEWGEATDIVYDHASKKEMQAFDDWIDDMPRGIEPMDYWDFIR